MSLLDLAVLAVLAMTVALGAWAGLFPQLLGLLGAAGGFAVALLLASTLQGALTGIEQPMRAFVAVAGLVALTLLGEAIGSALGTRVRVAMRERMLGAVDLAGGMLVGFGQGVLAVWIVGGLVLAGALPGLEPAVNRSLILGAVNRVLPPPEGVAQQIVGLLAPTEFPNLFAGLEPPPAEPLDLPPSGVVRTLALSGEGSTVQVVADGCGREQLGTGFFIADHVVVTNAHVVSGGETMAVALAGVTHRATLILFDPRQDVALLRVPSVSAPPLELASSAPQRGTRAAAIGFPGGGGMTVIPAVVTASFGADGPDIYGSGTVSRSIVEVRAGVRRGDSGGPLLIASGVVGGIVFGASRADPTVGYAIAADSVATELREGATRSSSVDSGACLAE